MMEPAEKHCFSNLSEPQSPERLLKCRLLGPGPGSLTQEAAMCLSS